MLLLGGPLTVSDSRSRHPLAVSFLAAAVQAGFQDARHVSAEALNERYFSGRTDGLGTARGEELLIATT